MRLLRAIRYLFTGRNPEDKKIKEAIDHLYTKGRINLYFKDFPEKYDVSHLCIYLNGEVSSLTAKGLKPVDVLDQSKDNFRDFYVQLIPHLPIHKDMKYTVEELKEKRLKIEHFKSEIGNKAPADVNLN